MLSSSYGIWQKPQLGGDGSSNLANDTYHLVLASTTQSKSYWRKWNATVNNLWSVLPMSRQPSRIYRGFRMAAVPDADRMHTSSLCWEEMERSTNKEREEDENRTWILVCLRQFANWLQKRTSGQYFPCPVCVYYDIPDASALTVPHDSMATKSFGMRFDLLTNLLPPGIASLWLICKTQ